MDEARLHSSVSLLGGTDREFASCLANCLQKVRRDLLSQRSPEGHWSGELSSSALSTATAVCALSIVARHTPSHGRFDVLIERGLRWLRDHSNSDGGWGDTVLSLSNISTTALCWAAFGAAPGADQRYRDTVENAVRWLGEKAGGLAPDRLATAVIQRYGKDRTFSVPILTMCALAGRLGPGAEAWRWVLPLPFELAAFPHSWFAALRLPVVSYALPALIAIGQARHHHRPSRNPLARFCRNIARRRTLNKLQSIQPPSGGFLEATPLTSFVVMSLAGSGQAQHPVTIQGVEFLCASAREDGSWPIDTNLATWVTTLSVNALCKPCHEASQSQPIQTFEPSLSIAERGAIRQWLLGQQYRQEHPYTHAAPGGWAWTNLSGGVPDADDTAGALLALYALGDRDEETSRAAARGIEWLLNLQNRDGGIPTFCRGWGTLPFDRSSPDLTAHALRAWNIWLDHLPAALGRSTRKAIQRALNYLIQSQKPNGAWIPLWFGNQFARDDENPLYGTARVLLALRDLEMREPLAHAETLERAVGWLISAQAPDGGWGGDRQTPSSIEETALALEALAPMLSRASVAKATSRDKLSDALIQGARWLLGRIQDESWRQPSPIGFYFAKLWYYERLYPVIFTTGALAALEEALHGRVKRET